MSNIAVIRQRQTLLARSSPQSEWATQTARALAAAASISEVNAAQSATNAEQSNQQAAAKLAQATIQADRAAGFAGGSIPVAHAHTTGPRIIEPEYSRNSAAFDFLLKRWEYNERRWGPNGTLIGESTTNMLTEAASLSLSAATDVTVVSGTKYTVSISGTGSITLSGAGSGTVTAGSPVTITAATTTLTLTPASTATYVQVEAKSGATSWITGGQTRAADSFYIPVNAYQKNLLTPNQATGGDTLGDTTGFTAVNGGTLTRDTTEHHSGTGCIKYVSANAVAGEGVAITSPTVIAGKIYADSVYLKGSGTVRIYARGASDAAIADNGADITLTSTWTRYQVLVAVPGAVNTIQVKTTTQQAATIYVDTCQLEEGATASDWTLPAIDYTNALINPTAFSVELGFNPTVTDTSAEKYVWGVGTANDYLLISTNATTGYYKLSHRYNGGTVRSVVSAIAAAVGVNKGFKISASGSTLTFTIDGTDIGTCQYDGLPSMLGWLMYFGGNYAGSSQRNGWLSNVRVRNTSLTATERAYTGIPTPDQYTTYCSECKESISSRPYVKDAAGVAQRVIIASDSPNQNAIFNGDFRLATRGTIFSPTGNNVRIFDGMKFSTDGTATVAVNRIAFPVGQNDVPLSEYYLQHTCSAIGTSTYFYYDFIAEKLLQGKQKLIFTANSPEKLAISKIQVMQLFGTGGSSAVITDVSSIKLNTNLTKYKIDVTLPSIAGKTTGAGSNLLIRFSVQAAVGTVNLADVQLKPADAPDSYPRLELEQLQGFGRRYLQSISASVPIASTKITTNTIEFAYRFPVTMRAVPALSGTYAETTNWQTKSTDGTAQTGFSIALLNATVDGFTIQATKSAHGLTGPVSFNPVTNILYSAEL